MSSISGFFNQPQAVNAGSGNGTGESSLLPLINLNQVFQTSLELYQETITKSSPIIRCDILPSVQGDSVQMQQLFNLVIKMILLNLPIVNNLFIYIKCDGAKDEVMDLSIPAGFNKYSINVFSNAIHILERADKFEQEISECKTICTKNNGHFEEHTSSDSGCLFTISLFGKMN